MSNTFVIPDHLKNADLELMTLALKAITKVKEKADAKASVKREKKQPTEEEIKATKLKEMIKALATANGLKTPTKDYSTTTVNRRKGTASICDDLVIQKAEEVKCDRIYLRTGKKSAYVFTTILVDFSNIRFIWKDTPYTSLYELHKAYCPGATFSKKSTLNSSYYGHSSDSAPVMRLTHRLDIWENDFIRFTEKNTPAPTPAPAPAPGACPPIVEEEILDEEEEIFEEEIVEEIPPIVEAPPEPKKKAGKSKK